MSTKAASAPKARTRRQAEPVGRRSASRTTFPSAAERPNDLSTHPLVPKNIRDVAPSITAKRQRFLQILSRHLEREIPWLTNIVRVAVDQRVGTGPTPVSPFDRLNQLWREWRGHIDPRADYSWGGLHREAYRECVLVGEVFWRVRSRLDRTGFEHLPVPLQFELLPSEFCPIAFDQRVGDLEYVCGIARDKIGRTRYYAFHTEHPLETTAGYTNPIGIPAEQVFHLAERRLGSPRGQVPLASALLRLIKMATLEDAEVKRKIVSTLMSVFVTRPVNDGDDFELPSEEEVSEMIDEITLSPGGVFELPYGYKAESVMPKDEPANYERALKWLLMSACAAVGILPHEVIGEIDIVERLGRYINLIQERQCLIAHDAYEFQVLDPMWRVFVDHVLAADLWEPDASIDTARLYDVEWEWDLVPLASFNQELRGMLEAQEAGIIPTSYTQKTMFQLDPATVAVQRAREAAREKAIAKLAERFEAEALAQLEAELALADA